MFLEETSEKCRRSPWKGLTVTATNFLLKKLLLGPGSYPGYRFPHFTGHLSYPSLWQTLLCPLFGHGPPPSRTRSVSLEHLKDVGPVFLQVKGFPKPVSTKMQVDFPFLPTSSRYNRYSYQKEGWTVRILSGLRLGSLPSGNPTRVTTWVDGQWKGGRCTQIDEVPTPVCPITYSHLFLVPFLYTVGIVVVGVWRHTLPIPGGGLRWRVHFTRVHRGEVVYNNEKW